MTFTHPSRAILRAGALALSSLLLVSCSSALEAPAPAESASATESVIPGEDLPSLPETPELPEVLPGEGDGSVDHGLNPLAEGERVEAEPDAISFQVEPAAGLTVNSGMVTVHWAATAGGVPIAADDCEGMLTIMMPDGGILTFEPEITGCNGSTGILLSENLGTPPGDYVVSVMLSQASGEQTISVAAGA
ncbi:hypothetical protein [Corynebacterium sp. A21]|uniref:hypothetical protein n=1 Tax=Corynebacterium sp. A21 TaxID=3457318 RepID=UPI003FD3E05A